MKIIHVLSCLSKGGGERVVVELANKGVENGDEVAILCGWPVDPDFFQNRLNTKIKIKFIGQKKSPAYIKIIPWIFKNKKWICSYDILHCHLTYGAVFGSLAKIILRNIFRKKQPPIIETNHAVGMPVPKFNRWLHSRMILLRDGVVFMAADPYWDNLIKKHPRLKTEIIPNGISVTPPQINRELKNRYRQQMGIPGDCKYIVGTVSMLRPDRNPLLYIPIFHTIHKALGNDVKFILAGGGSEFDKIKDEIEKYDLSKHVLTPGFINDPLITICNMDVYVSLSVGGAAGISMIEAAMCKVPVIGIQMDKDYITKSEDWVWSHTDVKEVAQQIIFLLQNPDERNSMAETETKYAFDHFTSEAMYSSYKFFYNKILNG